MVTYGSQGRPARRPDQGYDPPVSPVAPTQAAGVLRARRVIVAGPGEGIFSYSPTVGFGNLVASTGVVAAGVDQYGNAYIAGDAVYWSAGGKSYVLTLTTATFLPTITPGLAVGVAASAAGPYVFVTSPTTPAGSVAISSAQDIALTTSHLLLGRSTGLITIVAPSGDTSGATDVVVINGALTAGTALLTPGTFYINAPLTPPGNSSLIGSGSAATVINQVTNADEGITCTNVGSITLRGFFLAGNGSTHSTAAGIHFASNPASANIIVDDVTSQGFGLQGFLFDSVFLTNLRRCEALQNGGIGFQITNSFADPTSFSLQTCYANGNGGNGYEFDAVQYSSLNGCAADGNPTGYAFLGCIGVVLNGCGTESFTTTGFLFNNCTGCGLHSGFTFNGKTKAVWVTNGTTRQTVGGFTEASPAAGAVAALQTDAGTSSVVWGITHVTADSIAAGTITNVDGSA